MVVALVTSGCATSYQDPRPVEVREQEVKDAISSLSGEYIIKDSRNDFKNFNEVWLYPMTGSITAELTNAKGYMLKVHGGSDCVANYRSADNYARLFCSFKRPGEMVSMVNVERILTPKTVRSGSVLFGFKDMQIDNGYLLTYYLGNNGRPYHYHLVKKDKSNR